MNLPSHAHMKMNEEEFVSEVNFSQNEILTTCSYSLWSIKKTFFLTPLTDSNSCTES